MGAFAKIEWLCLVCGGRWSAAPSNIIHAGRGCPNCTQLRTERHVRLIFERLTGLAFVKQRPWWLNGLELDGYNDTLRLAWEYNGEQHYQLVEHWSDDLEAQQERDLRKQRICREFGVDLIVIPYTQQNNLLWFIANALAVRNIVALEVAYRFITELGEIR